LIGLMKEADAENDAALQVILKEYEQILEKNPTNIVRPADLAWLYFTLTQELAYH
jgi:hypothetical protein